MVGQTIFHYKVVEKIGQGWFWGSLPGSGRHFGVTAEVCH